MKAYRGWAPFQQTVNKQIRLAGIGLHSGKRVNVTIKPGKENEGIHFLRTDVGNVSISARMDRVIDTSLATTVSDHDVSVSTTEHLLASLVGLGVDNAVIELDAPEVPIMDGSAAPFVRLLKQSGFKRQKAFKKILKITREISVTEGDMSIRVIPYNGLRITCEIDFDHPAISSQRYSSELSPEIFAHEISQARTFGFLEEVEKLRQHGKAQGGSLENAVVIDKTGVLNRDGLRFENEFVRHKVLDLVGDLALLGCPVMGHIIAYKSGHGMHLRLMQAIAARRDCWEIVQVCDKGERGLVEKLIAPALSDNDRPLPWWTSVPTLDGEGCPA